MKRRLLIIAIFLLLGAVVNVAVAWGCAVWLPWPHTLPFGDPREGFTRQGDGFSDWMDDVSVAAGIVRIHSRWLTGSSKYIGVEPKNSAGEILPAWGWFARPSGTYAPGTFVSRMVDARGWPVVSLWSGLESIGFPGPAAIIGNVVTVTNGYLPPAERRKPFPDWASLRVVPLMPIWPGFALNTLLYAALLWLLLLGPFALRRFLRVRRGLCPKCAYPMGESSVCSECGKPLPSST